MITKADAVTHMKARMPQLHSSIMALIDAKLREYYGEPIRFYVADNAKCIAIQLKDEYIEAGWNVTYEEHCMNQSVLIFS